MGTPVLKHYDTIVIGAGMSGVACAARLFDSEVYNSGKRNLLVLEGRSRIGGRIGAVNINGSRLDTGANWIHGTGTESEPNPLMKILPGKRLKYRPLNANVSFRAPKRRRVSVEGALDESTSLRDFHESVPPQATSSSIEAASETKEDDWTPVGTTRKNAGSDVQQTLHRLQTRSERLVIPPQVSSTLFGAIWTIIGSLHEEATSMPLLKTHNLSLLDTIMAGKSFEAAFREVPAEYHSTLQGLPQFVENMEAGPLLVDSATDGTTRPGLSLSEFAIDDFDGDQVFVRDGYLAIVEEVAKDLLQAGVVKLDSQVDSIDWSGEFLVIKTVDKDIYQAKKVICTIPLGVLQYHTSEERSPQYLTEPKSPYLRQHLFRPPLPYAKQRAISSLGFGVLDKVFLVYDRQWWKEEPYRNIVKKGLTRQESDTDDSHAGSLEEPDTFWGFTSELPGLSVSPDGVESGPRVISLINLNALTGFPVLAMYISCQNALLIESLSDAAAASIVHRALTRWFGIMPPKPSAVHVTRWHQDPFSRGSYTHMITNVSLTEHREEFTRPLVNRFGCEVRFAGEHTSRNHFATVHGALMSGWREADAILESESVG